MSLLLALLATWAAFAGTLTLDVLDVGQGDGILLRSPAGKAVLVDAGEQRTLVATQLAALGVEKLAMVVATHPHADHIGGMAEVLTQFPVGLYVDNGLPHTTATYTKVMDVVEAKAIPYKPAKAGQIYNLDDGIKLEVLNPSSEPLRGTRSDLNANSVVIRITHGKDCMLLTGDSELETEQLLVARKITPCEVLKVAHHGSAYSTTDAWIRAIKPRIALISVGTGNTYGHPSPDTVARLVASGAEVYRTDQQRGLRVESTGAGVKLTTGIVIAAQAVEPGVEPAIDGSCAFVSSGSSEVFHENSCGTGARIDPNKRACYNNREQAVAAGKRPASCCDP